MVETFFKLQNSVLRHGEKCPKARKQDIDRDIAPIISSIIQEFVVQRKTSENQNRAPINQDQIPKPADQSQDQIPKLPGQSQRLRDHHLHNQDRDHLQADQEIAEGNFEGFPYEFEFVSCN